MGGTKGLELGFGFEDSRVAGSGSGSGMTTDTRENVARKNYLEYSNGDPNDDPDIGLRSAPAG